jgi:hypothetical protein
MICALTYLRAWVYLNGERLMLQETGAQNIAFGSNFSLKKLAVMLSQ